MPVPPTTALPYSRISVIRSAVSSRNASPEKKTASQSGNELGIDAPNLQAANVEAELLGAAGDRVPCMTMGFYREMPVEFKPTTTVMTPTPTTANNFVVPSNSAGNQFNMSRKYAVIA